MNRPDCHAVCCSVSMPPLGGITAEDFSTLDHLAVKLICLDRDFAAPVRQLGRVVGERIAMEQSETSVSPDRALSALVSACGLEGVIESRFLHLDAEGARLEITGCAAVLDWEIPNVQRAVCGFDAGLFEGFLRGVTGEMAWRVEETACLGFGNPSCEFMIRREQASGDGVFHGHC